MPSSTDGQSTAALVLGIVSIALGFVVPLGGVICGIIGIVLGVKTRRQSKMGQTGFICAIVGVVISVIIWILSVIMISQIVDILPYLS